MSISHRDSASYCPNRQWGIARSHPGMRATARVFEVAPNTVLHWLIEAAEQLTAFSASFLCDLHLQQLQLDELYAVLSAVKEGEISEAKAIKRLFRSPHWVWEAIDPVS